MSSPTFINALRRFISVRGHVQQFHSDRGTNFVGSVKDLNVDVINVEDPAIKSFMDRNQSTWVFNPPYSSHMGGTWERLIGTTRRVLEAILVTDRKRNLTHDILLTLMCEVCAIVNSRPIAPVSTDPSQPSVLSPTTLLTQKTSTELKPFQIMDIKESYKSHWKFVQMLAQQFWKRWQNEYLSMLQSRKKWTEETKNLRVGDVVLLKEETVRYQWPMGVVVRTFPGDDSLVRKVEVRTFKDERNVVYTRPVTMLVHLFSP